MVMCTGFPQEEIKLNSSNPGLEKSGNLKKVRKFQGKSGNLITFEIINRKSGNFT